MKRLKSCLLVLLTLLLTGVGAGMPWAAARFQDRYGIAAQETLPLDAVTLTLRQESEIMAVLRLMSGSYEEDIWEGETNLDGEDACAAALDALAELERAGLLESGWMGDYGYIEPGILERLKTGGEGSAVPILYTSMDGTSAVIWLCTWNGKLCPSYTLQVDDATGKAVSGFLPSADAAEPEDAYRRMDRWRVFFQDYYGIEIPTVEENVYDAASEFIFHFDPEDGGGPLGLRVGLYAFEMDFFPCALWEFPQAVYPAAGEEGAALTPWLNLSIH